MWSAYFSVGKRLLQIDRSLIQQKRVHKDPELEGEAGLIYRRSGAQFLKIG